VTPGIDETRSVPLPIPQTRIRETEVTLGVSFPAAFKMYMGRSNGGSTEIAGEAWFLFSVRDATTRETLRRTAEDLVRETARAIEANLGFPSDGVAIAHNGAGDLLFLRRHGNQLGNEVWIYRLHGGELSLALDDVAELWEHDAS